MTTNTNTTLQFRPADERGRTQFDWLNSWHSFSFGRYYDPANVNFRALRVINDDYIAGGGGFGEHGHDNMEILTWVLAGEIRHGDNLGNTDTLTPGELQAMTAGRGIRHSEVNESDSEQVHLLQIWIEPAQQHTQPGYDQKPFPAANRQDRWQLVATGREGAEALRIGQDVNVSVADVSVGGRVTVELPAGRFGYLHLATGSVTVDGVTMNAGDAVTFEGGGLIEVVGRDGDAGAEQAELLLFDLA